MKNREIGKLRNTENILNSDNARDELRTENNIKTVKNGEQISEIATETESHGNRIGKIGKNRSRLVKVGQNRSKSVMIN